MLKRTTFQVAVPPPCKKGCLNMRNWSKLIICSDSSQFRYDTPPEFVQINSGNLLVGWPPGKKNNSNIRFPNSNRWIMLTLQQIFDHFDVMCILSES